MVKQKLTLIKLWPGIMFVSPLKRARETAQIIKKDLDKFKFENFDNSSQR